MQRAEAVWYAIIAAWGCGAIVALCLAARGLWTDDAD